ncbi:MAG: CRTAC1 family protein [Aeromicrobium sp.]
MADAEGSPPSHATALLLAGIAAGVLVAAGLIWTTAAATATRRPPAGGPPHLVEQAAAAGIDHVYDGEFTFFVGGGVAVFDCDDDHRPDVYLAGGVNAAALYSNVSAVGGDLRFEEISDPATDLTDVVGAYPIDIDGDGHVDLIVLRIGENVILRGLGGCRFARANEALGFDGGSEWTTAFSATWEDDSGLPTLALGNYLALDAGGEQTGTCAGNTLYRPVDGGYSQEIPLEPGLCTLSIQFSDWDHSGRHDLRMTNDRHYYRDGEEQLWRVEAGEAPVLYGREDGWHQMQIWGMGIASQDVTGDGVPEVFLTSQADNKLQTLEEGAAGPSYTDIALARGVTATRPFLGDTMLPSTAWHPEFADVNNDGLLDLYVSKGNVEAQPDFATEDPSDLFLGQSDGTFVEAAQEASMISLERSRGAAIADFNLDGLVDIIEVNRREPVKLWRNAGAGDARTPLPMGNWIALDLEQPSANRDAIGAWVSVRFGDHTIEREVMIGGGHASGELGWLQFGIGDAPSAKVRLEWPDGETGPWMKVDAGTFATISRGADEPMLWSPLD